MYPSHLRSEVDSFDRMLPNTTLGELSCTEQLRLFRLNGLPDRPCSARFTLPDNTIDSKTILDKIVSRGSTLSVLKGSARGKWMLLFVEKLTEISF